MSKKFWFVLLFLLPLVSAETTDTVIGGLTGPFASIVNMIKGLALAIAIAVPVMAIIGIIGYLGFIKPKMYNLTVIFNMTRSGGEVTNAEVGRGRYDIDKGIVLLKRPRQRKPIEMKCFDVKKYIYGDNLLQVAQIGASTYVPIHPKSLSQYEDDDGNTEYFIDINADVDEQLLWGQGYKLRAKATFSIMDWLRQHEAAIAIGFVVLAQAISTAFIIAVIR